MLSHANSLVSWLVLRCKKGPFLISSEFEIRILTTIYIDGIL
jgi:hypothetical protein